VRRYTYLLTNLHTDKLRSICGLSCVCGRAACEWRRQEKNRSMTDIIDGTAYMMLATCNAQGELSALERGTHALNSGMDVKAYAASVGRARTTVHDEVYAAEVARAVPQCGTI